MDEATRDLITTLAEELASTIEANYEDEEVFVVVPEAMAALNRVKDAGIGCPAMSALFGRVRLLAA